jgi:signal transduction histidine kinase
LLDGAGRPSGWVGTLADITAEAAAAEAMTEARDHATEASRLKSDFLSNMSHEIRTPMSGVIGWTELLMDTDLDAPQLACVQSLTKAGDTLMSVVNAILDFSKIETGQLVVENVEFSPRTVVDEVVDLLAGSAREQELELVALLDDSVPAVVTGDPNRLRQVLTNLTGNAIKFTQTGGVTIRVTAETAGSATVVRFEISDTGVGIPADKLALIFEPFTQADTSITRKYGGTGLGLTICSRLTALMGGQIGVDSELGEGSIFWFTIGAHPVGAGLNGDARIAEDNLAKASSNGSQGQESPSLSPRRQEG